MTNTQGNEHTYDGCLMCAVRALTEGTPAIWQGRAAGDEITGVVLRLGTVNGDFDNESYPFVDLWLGDLGRRRVVAYSGNLKHQIHQTEPKIGDRLTVHCDGERAVPSGRHRGLNFKAYTVTVERGHH